MYCRYMYMYEGSKLQNSYSPFLDENEFDIFLFFI